jgi:hypothetical protein
MALPPFLCSTDQSRNRGFLAGSQPIGKRVKKHVLKVSSSRKNVNLQQDKKWRCKKHGQI